MNNINLDPKLIKGFEIWSIVFWAKKKEKSFGPNYQNPRNLLSLLSHKFVQNFQ